MAAEACSLSVGRAAPDQVDAVTSALAAVRCPYVAAVRFEIWTATAAARPAVDDIAAALATFGIEGSSDPPTALVVQLRESASTSIDALRAAVVDLAILLGDPPARQRAEALAAPDQWWLRAAGARWFVTVHAALYPPQHARHWPLAGPIATFVPEWAFQSMFPEGPTAAARRAVRAAFAAADQRYPLTGGAVSSVETG
ncbi:hypothetical protein [Sorangium sp. So ce542]|uniref:hypothetical protein n=1 Tax=Sorangium sp. So ce542 TaxID=3133316 RepID=UPI003F632F1D